MWETIHKSMRALYDSSPPETAVPLGMLTAEYMKEKKQPDSFFRGVCDLLVACTRSELNQLQSISKTAAQMTDWVGEDCEGLRFYSDQCDAELLLISKVVDGQQYGRAGQVASPDWPTLVRRLSRFEIAREVQGFDGPICDLSLDRATRLWGLLRNMQL